MPRKPDTTIIGKTFNNLKVIELTDQKGHQNRPLYKCQCLLCGNERLVIRGDIVRGDIKDCGCSRHKPKNNLVGKMFGELYVEDTKIINNQLKYLCRCNLCGRETLVLPQALKEGRTKTCGNHNKDETAYIKKTYVAGTAPCKLINTDKTRSTNTSGVTGVSYDKSRNKWAAEIMFKKKKYYLGRFENKDDAVIARKQAEKEIFGEFLKWYEEYKENLKNSSKPLDK